MKYFTREQIEEIRKQLATLGVKDTDLPNASELNGDELVAIIQDSINKKVGIRTLIRDFLPEDIAAGADGKSAFELWKELPGNQNKTIEDFFESLKGEKGDKGDPGSGDGSSVSWNQKTTTGTNIADIVINGRTTHVYAPNSGGGGGQSYTLPVADDNTLGGVMTGKQENDSDRIYPLRVDGEGRGFVHVPWSGGGTEGDGRSITSAKLWYKLTTNSNLAAPTMDIVDPSSVGWSLTFSYPTENLPYLRAFMQFNYDKPIIIDGVSRMYSRTAAYTAYSYSVSGSTELQQLIDDLNALQSELNDLLNGYEGDLMTLSNSLTEIRNRLQAQITNQYNELQALLASIEGSDVQNIIDNEKGLWGVLTSYVNEEDDGTTDHDKRVSFAQILLDAENVSATLSAGSQFFGFSAGTELKLSDIKARLSAIEADLSGLATLDALKSYVDAKIASASLELGPGVFDALVAVSHLFWTKESGEYEGYLYPYNLYWEDYIETHSGSGESDEGEIDISEYEEYMGKSHSEGGPDAHGSGSAATPGGPFVSIAISEKFSELKMTVDSITAAVNAYKYMWEDNGYYLDYEYFRQQYNQRPDAFISDTYDEYVINRCTPAHGAQKYTKVEVAQALSSIMLSVDNIRSMTGDIAYFWRKKDGSSYRYQAYVIPANKTREQYEADMTTNLPAVQRWTKCTYISRMSVIDQFPDQITSMVENSTLVWINDSLDADDPDYRIQYDNWKQEYRSQIAYNNYEDYVTHTYPGYQLMPVIDSFSVIKESAERISATVTSLGDDLSTAVTNFNQTADEVRVAAAKGTSYWEHPNGTMKDYQYFNIDYLAYKTEHPESTISYEEWVTQNTDYSLNTVYDALGALRVSSDKIWAGVGDGQGNVAAAISILKGLGVENGKIILDSDSVDFISTNSDNDSKIEIKDGFIDFYDGDGNLRLRIGQGINDATPVLKFFSADDSDNPIYDLGPDGMKQYDSTFSAPRFNATRFWYFPTLSNGNKIVAITEDMAHHDYGQNAIFAESPLFWFKYTDAMKVIWLTEVQSVVQYQNPDTGEFSSNNSKYNNKYFLNGDFSYSAADGYYVIDNALWENGTTVYTVKAPALRIVTENNVKKYYFGVIELSLSSTDVDYGGVSGTITDIKVNSLFE